MSPRIVVIIPARFGSRRFPGKPLARIAGKPMIQRVYERAQQAGGSTEVVVATDDRRIRDAVTALEGQVVMTSRAHQSGTDRAAEAAERLHLGPDDIVVNVQGDQPLLDPHSIVEVTAPFMNRSGVEMATLAVKINRLSDIDDPNNVKVVFDNQGGALYFSRSPIPHGRDLGGGVDVYKHVGTYAYTVRFLQRFTQLPQGRLEQIEKLEQLRALEHGHRIMVTVTGQDSPSVDVPEDVAKVEAILKKAKPSGAI